MKIAVRGGHTEKCCGAVALISELKEDRLVKDAVIKYLKKIGHTVYDVTPPKNYTSDENVDLNYGVNKANSLKVDMFISIHFNKAYNSYDGAIGTEVCVYSKFEEAQRVVDAISSLGFKNRGQKIRGNELYELRATNMKSMIVEVCFVEATKDVELYKQIGYDKVGKAIAEAISNKKVQNSTTNQSKPQEKPNTSKQIYRVRKEWKDAGTQKGAYSSLDNAINECKKHKGYKVYDEKGNQVYPKINNKKELWEVSINGQIVKDLQYELNKQCNAKLVCDGYFGEDTLNKCIVVKKGAKGNITKIIQRRLKDLKYLSNVDGIFGNDTYNAVVKFQKSRGLTVDGIVGKNTWKELFKK